MPPRRSRTCAWPPERRHEPPHESPAERSDAPHPNHPPGRHRRQRHERHRRGAPQPGLRGARLRPQGQRRHRAAGAARRESLHRPLGREPRQRRRRRGFDRRQPRQPGSGGRAGEPHSRGAARRDAGRADALPLFGRGGRHPRQDHHDQPGGERTGGGRPRPDLRHRRTAKSADSNARWARAGIWSPRPTRAMPRSCTCSR